MSNILFVFFVVGLIFVLMYTRTKKNMEGFGMFYDQSVIFANNQSAMFQDPESKSIYINKDSNLDNLNSSLQQPEIYLPKSPDRDYRNFFKEDNADLYAKENKLCRNATHPSLLPKREKKSRLGCGWYFSEDPSEQSVGVFGSRNEPLYKNDLPHGDWIWDLDLAAKREDIKYCIKYKTCDALNIESVAKKCGFCPSEGHAIPVNSDGTQKYPLEPNGSCSEETITNPNRCRDASQVQTITTTDGTNCSNLGSPSDDNSFRKYTKEECDTLNGVYSNTGLCNSKTSGSYSWDCRMLNTPASLLESINLQSSSMGSMNSPSNSSLSSTGTVCNYNSNGEISTDCLKSLALDIGFNKNGGLIQIWTKQSGLSTAEYDAFLTMSFIKEYYNYLGFNVLFLTLVSNSPVLPGFIFPTPTFLPLPGQDVFEVPFSVADPPGLR